MEEVYVQSQFLPECSPPSLMNVVPVVIDALSADLTDSEGRPAYINLVSLHVLIPVEI